jgi:hypothetical protein
VREAPSQTLAPRPRSTAAMTGGWRRLLISGAGLAGAVALVLCCFHAATRTLPALLSLPPQQLQDLSGELWASLDNSVPLKSAANVVDIGGSVVSTLRAHEARPAGLFTGGAFLADAVRSDPNHAGVYGGMYWGQDTVPKLPARQARGRGREGDKWLREPAHGQRAQGSSGIIKALEHQASPAPPAWWIRKRQEWLQKRRLAHIKKALTKHLVRINPDYTGRLLSPTPALRMRGPALSDLQSVPMRDVPQKRHKNSAARSKAGAHTTRHPRVVAAAKKAHTKTTDIVILPGKRVAEPKAGHSGGKFLPKASTVKKAIARAEAIRQKDKQARLVAAVQGHKPRQLADVHPAVSGSKQVFSLESLSFPALLHTRDHTGMHTPYKRRA